jgi:hypothetical protein
MKSTDNTPKLTTRSSNQHPAALLPTGKAKFKALSGSKWHDQRITEQPKGQMLSHSQPEATPFNFNALVTFVFSDTPWSAA